MHTTKKLLGDERREQILQWLIQEKKPITGSDLAKRTNVSRQVIVQDISLLKAKDYPILATPQGYVYVAENDKSALYKRVIACCHTPAEMEKELTLIVDHGVTVKDVTVEHPVYGDLTASIMVSNRLDVSNFIQKIKETKASLLSELTDGIHLHTLEAPTIEQLDKACEALKKENILME